MDEIEGRELELSQQTKALQQLSAKLSKYLSPQVYDSIFSGRQDVKVSSTRKKLTVFFSDIVGFTEAADRMESEELTNLLNNYLTEMTQIALNHGATIDKYIGDAIMAFFGDPETRGAKEDALACVNMAIAMRDRLRDLADDWRHAGIEIPLNCRAGIHTGYCTVGNFGSETRMDYTIIGGPVNLASRLESAAEPGQILISYETFALVQDEIECKEMGHISVKGISYPIATYLVAGRRDRAADRILEKVRGLSVDIDLSAMTDSDRQTAESLPEQALALVRNDDQKLRNR
jgi:class 3 adenylate cyclase